MILQPTERQRICKTQGRKSPVPHRGQPDSHKSIPFCLQELFPPMQCSQAGPEAPQHPRCSGSSREHIAEKTKCAQCGGARLWVHSSAAHNLHVKLHGHLPLLALSLVSQHDVSKPQVSLLSEKDITVNTSFETYSFLSPISHYFLTAKMKVLL